MALARLEGITFRNQKTRSVRADIYGALACLEELLIKVFRHMYGIIRVSS